ncbi:MAG TPA: hypothetical protein VI981_01825 [Candidatus Paceibacterota bacterium]
MANVIQMQRRAIESLRPKAQQGLVAIKDFFVMPKPLDFRLKPHFPLFLYGISVGIGTCSDIHGMNVGVFGLRGPGIQVTSDLRTELTRCEFFVKLRPLTVAETQERELAQGLRHTHELRLLSCAEVELNGSVTCLFDDTGVSSFYVTI